MVQTHIIGLPIIGKKRELKSLLENYTNKSISWNFFYKKFKDFLRKNISLQEKNLDFINIGSFTYPDILTSTLLLLNLIKSDYLEKNIINSIINITKGSKYLKPFKMVKWFGTNFHYFIPVLEENINKINKINDFFIKTDLRFAKKKIKKKITVLGPFSIKYILIKNNIKFCTKRIVEKFKILLRKYKNKIDLFQFEEPFFKDGLSDYYIKIYRKIYKNFSKKEKIIFTNYFSRIKDNIKYINTYGIHLDLVENKYKINFIKKITSRFKKVSLGVINGRSVWVCSFINILKIINKLSSNLLISSNCSFLHIPYDVSLEDKKKFRNFFSFFVQKIEELNLIKNKINRGKGEFYKNFAVNKEIKKRKKRISNVKIRKCKKKKFVNLFEIGLKKFPITTIGSFSQTTAIRKIRENFRKKKINFRKYFNIIKKEILNVVKIQKKTGVNVLTNGEIERNDMVQFFCERINGFLITKHGWVQSYCTRCVRPPIINDDINNGKIEIYKWLKFIKLKKIFLKAIFTGPITIFKWSFNMENLSPVKVIFKISKIIRNKISSIIKKKIRVVQIDEPAIREFIDSGKNKKTQREIIVDSFNYICSVLKNKKIQVHTHICYSELNYNDILMFKKMSIDVITIESSSNLDKNISLIKKHKLYKSLEIGLGIYNVHSKLIPSGKKIFKNILKICKSININRIWINPDCGLKTRKKNEIILLLKKMSVAVKKIKKTTC
ncbi:cobalamin-independent homocysteine transmethylase [Candidatus Vidania fulgoroideae]|nr:cobalamin-independent homocysteine transmethylase [Candidatus Vidania fulgoroideae]